MAERDVANVASRSCNGALMTLPFLTATGKAPKTVTTHSLYAMPLDISSGRVRGNSRRWGDADPETKVQIAERAARIAGEEGLSRQRTAELLALIALESGFNPDAAAGGSSASGLGQFIKATGAAYGLTRENIFSVDDQLRAVVTHFKENTVRAQKLVKEGINASRTELQYALHHDGPTLQYGGLELARSRFVPLVHRFERWLRGVQARCGAPE